MDLVLAVVKDRRLSDLEVWARSLAKCGFTGRKVMLVEDVPEDAQQTLRDNGVEVIPFTTPNCYKHLHFQSYRYAIASDFLRDKDFRFIIWTDVCDLAFQSDPTIHLREGKITVAREGRLIGVGNGQGWNEIWLRKFLPSVVADSLLNEEVFCSGSIAGDAVLMRQLIAAIWGHCEVSGEMRGIDQGIFNYLVRKDSQFSAGLRVPTLSEGFVATVGMFQAEENIHEWTEQPPFLDRSTGFVLTHEGGKPFSIVHQYDRNGGLLNPHGDWRAILERRYR